MLKLFHVRSLPVILFCVIQLMTTIFAIAGIDIVPGFSAIWARVVPDFIGSIGFCMYKVDPIVQTIYHRV